MGQVLHGSATTTAAVRRAIQHSQESLRALARHYGLNQKTVAKWKRRSPASDLPTGPKDVKSSVLSIQMLATQRDALLQAGVEPDGIYQDLACGRHDPRLGLAACLKALRPGNTLGAVEVGPTRARSTPPGQHGRGPARA